MKASGCRYLSSALLAWAAILSSSRPALGCAVCFGDPGSAATQGAKAGILILLAVVGAVLVWIASVALFWIWRARRRGALQRSTVESTGRSGQGSCGPKRPQADLSAGLRWDKAGVNVSERTGQGAGGPTLGTISG